MMTSFLINPQFNTTIHVRLQTYENYIYTFWRRILLLFLQKWNEYINMSQINTKFNQQF